MSRLRKALYHRFGQGYEQALEAAKDWLLKQAVEMEKVRGVGR